MYGVDYIEDNSQYISCQSMFKLLPIVLTIVNHWIIPSVVNECTYNNLLYNKPVVLSYGFLQTAVYTNTQYNEAIKTDSKSVTKFIHGNFIHRNQ